MPDYPPGYDPSQVDYISAEDQAIGGLIALGAFGAVGLGVFLTVGAVGADIVTATVVDGIMATTTSMTVEELIAAEMIADGASAAEATTFIFNASKAFALKNGMSEIAAIAYATSESNSVVGTAQAHLSEVNAAIITAAARVQEQRALSAFFTSGMGHF